MITHPPSLPPCAHCRRLTGVEEDDSTGSSPRGLFVGSAAIVGLSFPRRSANGPSALLPKPSCGSPEPNNHHAFPEGFALFLKSARRPSCHRVCRPSLASHFEFQGLVARVAGATVVA